MDLCSYYNNNKILIYYNDKLINNITNYTDFIKLYNGSISYIYELKNKYYIYICNKDKMKHELLMVNKNIENIDKYYKLVFKKYEELKLNKNKLFILNNKELQFLIENIFCY